MEQAVKRCVIAVSVTALAQREAFAATGDGDPGGSRLLIFSITVAIASVVAVWLYSQSRRMSETEGRSPGEERAGDVAQTGGESAMPAILQEVARLRGSAQQRQEVARALANVMTQKMEEKVNAVQHELAQQYEQVIEQKTRSEAVVRKRYEATLTEKQQTESVVRSLAEGLVVVDNAGKVVFMNPAAEGLLGVKKEDKLGRPLSEDMKDEQLVSLIKGAPDEGEREVELSAKRDDTKKVLRASNAVIEDEDGKTVGMVSVLTDVTKQRELDRFKSEFVSKVTHELRTPLVAIQHSLAVVLNQTAGRLAGTQEKFLSNANRNVERLGRLIDDLLDLGKLEARKMELRREPTSLTQLIGAACETLNPWASSKGIVIEQRIQDTLPEVHADPERLTQVLQNLLGNAIKFTPQRGRITVEVKPRDGGQELEVSVVDTGMGIAKEDLPKLFKKFQQVGERSVTDINGTGLGLAIAKEIVELHKGHIWAESEQGHGAKFAFTVPVATRPHAGG